MTNYSTEHLEMRDDLFLDNKYTKWYYRIIESAKVKNRKKKQGEDLENHHIIPECCEGPNSKENRVMFSFREHFVCHRLLTRMMKLPVNKQKMGFAISWFCSGCKNHYARKFTSRDYENARKDQGKAMKGIKHADEHMEALWASRRGIPISDEHKMMISVALKKPISCQLIGPDDTIYDTDDLKQFCEDHDLKFNYLRSYYHTKNDVRMIIPKSRGWGIYFGIVQPIRDYEKIKSDAIRTGWKNRKAKGEIVHSTKIWTFLDPEGVIQEIIGLSKYCRENSLPLSQPSNIPFDKVMVGKWEGWIKLSCTIS